ncbi:choice-of-anchor D domain-containing protein [Ktedonosporobacter rubrisoli]|uniref:Choice-of-anchor D domain-containing protein n=1 Tax=Ktedonosporobacter rubrisoli TaxID=2509675 RepID=A0A4P6JXC9_KTERU|nr:choice-of-anchor D domain-containing protein [Ktedonosporobacter rubrisoli]QBD80407.1 choice-of-anchor D domain-containing protein [Ktedonosporobacter rubrisoli]
MNSSRCPHCDEPLPDEANFCAMCGKSISATDQEPSEEDEHQTSLMEGTTVQDKTVNKAGPFAESGIADEPTLAQLPQFETPDQDRTGISRPATVNVSRHPDNDYNIPLPEQDQTMGESRRRTTVLDSSEQVTWHKEVQPSPHRIPVTLPPRPVSQKQPVLLKGPGSSRRLPPAIFVWVSLGVVIVLVLSGVFGVIATLGKGITGSSNNGLSLEVTPQSVAIGATMTLRGANFSSQGHIGLTRDNSIPVVDTSGSVIISADGNGKFTDTITVGPDWEAGPHTINAEDAATHKIASFPILVTGQGNSLRPSHLQLSQSSLDFGNGPQGSSTAQTVTLTNIGGGQISWKASSNQSWIQITPKSGTFVSGQNMKITIVADRSHLDPGSYNAAIAFISNAGNGVIGAKMQVSQLQSAPSASLQTSPGALSFSATDGGASPDAQTVTLNNPGKQTLQWSASTDSDWLSVSPQSASVAAGSSQTVQIRVNSSSLLPGTYNGAVTFTGQGSAQNSPQKVYVSVTISPRCTLQLSPSMLTFSGAYQQGSPAAQKVNIGGSEGCQSGVKWNASSNANWLTISAQQGSTPASPAVGVNTQGLAPGTYHGTIDITSDAGTQTLAVTLAIGQPAAPVMNINANALNFKATAGSDPSGQAITLQNSGNGSLNWTAKAQSSTGNWLSVSPASGALNGQKSTALNVSVSPPANLSPGNYTGTITINGTDGSGNAASGSPQTIPVNLTVVGPCTINVNPASLNFSSTASATDPKPQAISIGASGACANALNWTANVGTTAASGSWLSVSSASGSATLNNAGTTSVKVSAAGLAPGTYQGLVTIAAVDSVTQQPIGESQTVNVTFTVSPPCSLQAPSATKKSFSAAVGSNPAPQTFTVGVSSNCNGPVTITPTAAMASGKGWLSVSPANAQVSPGGSATFTVNVASSALAAGSYTGSISLDGTSNGTAIAGSPQSVGVALTVNSAATLGASPSSITINATTGKASQQLTINNSGGLPLSWTAALSKDSPSFLSLAPNADKNLAGGASDAVTLTADVTGVQGGKSYQGSLIVTAVDPSSGAAIAGSPITIPITVNVATPALQLSSTKLSFSDSVGGASPAPISLMATNTGGDGLTWTASGDPKASWLSVSPASGSAASGASTAIKFSVNTTGLAAGNYTATVTIKPSVGDPQVVSVTLKITGVTPTPTTPPPTPTASPPTPSPTASPPKLTPTPQPSPKPTQSPPAHPTPSATPDPGSSPPAATPTSVPSPTPSPTRLPSPTPTPQASPTQQVTPSPTPQASITPTPSPTPEGAITPTPSHKKHKATPST